MCTWTTTELGTARPATADPARLEGGSPLECDFCGRALRRGTAVERAARGDGAEELVLLCAECAFGTD
jgi:hypothetical protein